MGEYINEDSIFKYNKQDEWKMFSKKAMNKKYPEGGYKVIGEVIKKVGPNKELIIYNNHTNEKLYVQPFNTYRKLLYHRYGYLYCRELDGYVIAKKSNVWIWLCSIVTTGLIIVFLTWGLWNTSNGPEIDPNITDFETSLQRSADMDSSKILIPGFRDWNMEADTDEIYVALSNPDKNPCYFSFEIILEQTGETLFKTKLIPPGKAITKIKLPRKFPKGEYPVIVKINSYSLVNAKESMNGGESSTKIIAIER